MRLSIRIICVFLAVLFVFSPFITAVSADGDDDDLLTAFDAKVFVDTVRTLLVSFNTDVVSELEKLKTNFSALLEDADSDERTNVGLLLSETQKLRSMGAIIPSSLYLTSYLLVK